MASVTRLGDFCELLVTNLHSKEAQILGDFLCFLESNHLFSKNVADTVAKFELLFIPTSLTACGQSHKASTSVNYNSRAVITSKLLILTALWTVVRAL